MNADVLRERLEQHPLPDRAFTLMKVYGLRQLMPYDDRAAGELERRRKRRIARRNGDTAALRALSPDILAGKTEGIEAALAGLFGYASDR
jgi:hypothetical protein